MKTKRIFTPIILCFCLIASGILISACTPALAAPQKDDQSIIETAVAATLVQYIIETKVAEQSINLSLQATNQAVPTGTPAPTATPLPIPTEVPTLPPPSPTSVPTATLPPPQASEPLTANTALPEALAELDTNCRAGPSLYFKVVSYLIEGDSSPIHGRDSRDAYWYIEHPTKPGQYCWVWTGSTTTVGDTSKVPLIETPKVDDKYYDGNYGNYYNNYYGNYYGGYYPYCGSSWYGNWSGYYYPYCPSNVYNCKAVYKWNCAPVIKWTCKNPCKNNCKNPCTKNGCPPVTQVNFLSYCTKYPKCCK